MKRWMVLLCIGCSTGLWAQDTTSGPWKRGGAVGLNFSQVGLKNWSGGGENSLALNGLAALFANYKVNKLSWDNSLELGYGIVKQGDVGVRKSDDKMVFTSKFGRDAIGHWSYNGFVDFRTQFAPGYDYSKTPRARISEFMAPGYVTMAIGAQYKPDDHFFMLVSPVTGKLTFVLDEALSDAGAFGADSGKSSRSELGWLINSGYKRTLMEGIDFETKLNLFSGYKDMKHVDVIWDNQLLMKVNKYISASFVSQLVYDNDVKDPDDGKAKVQFKEVLSAGLLYKF